jgi:thymidine phosphorylase
MVKIIEAQGPAPSKSELGNLTADIRANRSGVVSTIDCLRLNRLARTAGAPLDKGAGIKLFKKLGNRVEQGEPLYRIHAFEPSGFDLAVGMAELDSAYRLETEVGASP